MRKRLQNGLAYVLIVLVGLACIVLVSLSAVGRQGIGWLIGPDLLSNLAADYDIQITVTLPAIDATQVAEIQATDEAALRITPDPGSIVTVPAGRFTPGATRVAQVTHTPTSTPTPLPTHTFTPAPSSTPTPTFQPTRTPTLPPTSTPTRTPTSTPMPTVPTSTPTPTSPPTNTPTSTNTPLPPSNTFTYTPTPSNTPTNTHTPTPTYTYTPTPTFTYTPTPTATNPPPPPPLSLTVVNTSTTLISLVWSNESASDADFLEYRVYRSTTMGGPYTLIASTGTTTAFVDSGLTTGTPYYYVVRGADAILQESANSPEASGVPSTISNPNPTPDCSAPGAPPDCGNAGGPPDGSYSMVNPGQTLILDLGAGNGILNGPGYDFVYYEREFTAGVVQMDWVTVELSIDQTNWFVAFAWSQGNEGLAQNSNVAPYAIAGGTNPDPNFCDLFAGASPFDEIRMNGGAPCPSWGGLYGTPPFNTGVAIDISVVPSPVGEGYRYIRIQTRPDAPQPAEIDGIQRLN